MKRFIFIIHSSDIIRRGLDAILRADLHLESILLKHIEDMDSYRHLIGVHFIVLTEIPDSQDLDLLFSLHAENELDIVPILDKMNENLVDDRIEHVLNTCDNKEKIEEILHHIIGGKSESRSSAIDNRELTSREVDILKQVALGLSNKEIADKLFISVHTVITHRKNITEKLGIKSISGLTVYAILNGVIDTNAINPEDLI